MGELVVAEREEAPAHKPRIGRPAVYTNEIGQSICDKVRVGCTIEAACGVHGVTRERYYEWRESREDFADMLMCAHAEAEAYYTSILHKATQFPVGSIEYKAAVEWLKRQRRAAWGDQIDIRRIDPQQLIALLQGQQYAIEDSSTAQIEDAFDVL